MRRYVLATISNVLICCKFLARLYLQRYSNSTERNMYAGLPDFMLFAQMVIWIDTFGNGEDIYQNLYNKPEVYSRHAILKANYG